MIPLDVMRYIARLKPLNRCAPMNAEVCCFQHLFQEQADRFAVAPTVG